MKKKILIGILLALVITATATAGVASAYEFTTIKIRPVEQPPINKNISIKPISGNYINVELYALPRSARSNENTEIKNIYENGKKVGEVAIYYPKTAKIGDNKVEIYAKRTVSDNQMKTMGFWEDLFDLRFTAGLGWRPLIEPLCPYLHFGIGYQRWDNIYSHYINMCNGRILYYTASQRQQLVVQHMYVENQPMRLSEIPKNEWSEPIIAHAVVG